MSRRSLLRLGAAGAVGGLAACAEGEGIGGLFTRERSAGGPDYSAGRLGARPRDNIRGPAPSGMQQLGSKAGDGFLYVPEGYDPATPAPLAMTLHGAGGEAERGLDLFLDYADERGVILVAPKARSQTWDVILGGFGSDVASIGRVLQDVFSSYAIDDRNLAISGFSDGASYALTLGLTNGDLFSHVIAFSPGFTAEEQRRGKPPVFISHGTRDGVLPIDQTSRQIVPRLEDAGYDVTFVEFDGGHVRRPQITGRAMEWWLD
ncbi:MAG: alpha/beta hydrolase-fold protein [Actinomycetota bacterium]|nr:alpha/beta hydrolase-fold protein [Actinomycetota bacterium]